jgi:nitrate/nitrite transporter NarK
MVFLIVIFSGVLWNGVSAFILTYINEFNKINLVIAEGLSTLKYTVGAFAIMLGGELSDRYNRRIIMVLAFVASLFIELLKSGDQGTRMIGLYRSFLLQALNLFAGVAQ